MTRPEAQNIADRTLARLGKDINRAVRHYIVSPTPPKLAALRELLVDQQHISELCEALAKGRHNEGSH